MSSATASAPAPSVEAEARAHEPSMEEILASIRRIIADDDVFPAARRRSQELAESVADSEPSASGTEEGAPSSAAREPALAPADVGPLRLARPEPEPPAAEEEATESGDEGYGDAPQGAELEAYVEEIEHAGAGFALETDAPLMSTDAASSIAAQFQTLAASMILNDSGLLQKYAQEMLRPMLKQWLDDNLPVIVERLVRAEIERVARGGGRR